MKVNSGKIKLTFLLAFIAAIIVCVAISLAGLFSAKSSVASADSVSADEVDETSETTADCAAEADNASATDNDADGENTSDNATVTLNGRTYTYDYSYTLNGSTCAAQASIWNNAMNAAKHSTNYVYVKLTANWTAASVSGNVTHSRATSKKESQYTSPQRTSFTGSYDDKNRYDGHFFDYGAIYVHGKVIIDLNGYTINRGLTSYSQSTVCGYVMKIGQGSSWGTDVIIGDSSSGGNGKITGGYNYTRGGGILLQAGKLELLAGHIYYNKGEYGGGVYMKQQTTFIQRGGYIEQNKAWEDDGGGVYVGQGCTYTLYGGYLQYNSTKYAVWDGYLSSISGHGGAACVLGTMGMYGGYVRYNYSNNTSGIAVESIGKFFYNSGTLSSNYKGGDSSLGSTDYSSVESARVTNWYYRYVGTSAWTEFSYLNLTYGNTNVEFRCYFEYPDMNSQSQYVTKTGDSNDREYSLYHSITATSSVGTYTVSLNSGGNEYIENDSIEVNIVQKNITLTKTGTVAAKTYDGTTAVTTLTQSNFTLTGLLDADKSSVGLEWNAYYSSADAGTNKTVYVNSFSLSGSRASNYKLYTYYNFSFTNCTINTYKTSVIWTNTSHTYNGGEKSPSAAYRAINATSNTSLTLSTTSGTSKATDVGTYTAYVTAPTNYEFLNTSCTWNITPQKIAKPYWVSASGATISGNTITATFRSGGYDEFVAFENGEMPSETGLNCTRDYSYNSTPGCYYSDYDSDEETRTFQVYWAGTYRFEWQLSSKNKTWSDGSTAPVELRIVINKATYSSTPTMTAKTVTYNGSAQTITAASVPTGVTATYTYTKSGSTVANAVDAGTYTVTAKFTGDSVNYNAIADKSATLTINKKEVTVSWRKLSNSTGYASSANVSNFTYTYDGSSHVPVPYFSGYIGGASKTILLPATGAQTNASTNEYTATATTTDYSTNYTFKDTTRTFKINAFKTSVSWTNTALEYNGSAQGPTAKYKNVSGTETTLTLTGTASATNAGSYTATVTAPTNYDFSNTSCSWRIAPKKIDLTWGSTVSFEYNGAERAPTATTTESGVTVTVKGAVNVGSSLTATASITSSNAANYTISNPTKTFAITQKSVAINWLGESGSATDFSYTYTGGTQCPTAYFTDVAGKTVNLAVTGGKINASTTAYTATATTSDYSTNYKFTGSTTHTFTINAAPVSVVWENLSFTYDGTVKNPTASYINFLGTKVALTLEPVYMNNSAVGEYTAQVKAPTDTNYQVTNDSKQAKFSILKANPTVNPTCTTSGLQVGMAMPALTTAASDTKGTISWVTSTLVQGTQNYTWVFVPNDTANYNTVTGVKSLTVAAAGAATITGITATATAKGEIYANTQLSDIANLLNITVTAAYSDGTTKPVTAGDYSITAFSATTGEVTVELKGDATKTAKFTVYITPKAVTGITVTYTPDGNPIYEGTALKDIKTVTVTANYNDGTDATLTSGYTYGGTLTAGTSTVVISYTVDGKTFKDSFEVTVTGATPPVATLTGIAASFVQNTVALTTNGVSDIASLGTLTVEGLYNDGTRKSVSASDYTLSLASGTTFTAGVNTVTVTLNGNSAMTTTITVIAQAPASKTKIYIVIYDQQSVEGEALITNFTYKVMGDATFAAGDITITCNPTNAAGTYPITGTYNGSTYDVEFVDGTYTITAKPAAEVKLTAKQTGTVYAGASADAVKAAFTFTVTVDGTPATLTASDYTLTPDLSNGKVSVTYTANGTSYTEEISVLVTPKAVTGITVTYTPDGNPIYEGAQLSTINTIVVKALYNDGTDTTLMTSDYKLSGNLAVGASTVVVSYTVNGVTYKDSFEVTVTAQGATAGGITATATNTAEVYANTKLTDLAKKLDIVVTMSYSDGTTSQVGANDYTITAFNGATGEVTVALNSDNTKTATFKVFVTPKAVTGITVTYTPDGNPIYEGAQLSSINTIVVKALYNDGTDATLNAGDYKLSGNLAVGASTVVVSYTVNGVTYKDSFEVTVTAQGATAGGITATATNTAEVYANTKLTDLAKKLDIVVTMSYSDGTTSQVGANDYTITAFNGATGEVTIQLNSDVTKTATFKVFVTPKAVTGITVTYTPDGNPIYEGAQLSSINTIVVKALYNDGTDTTLTTGDYKLSGNLAVGASTVVVSYTVNGVTYKDSFEVTVTAQSATVNGITASFAQNKTVYTTDTISNLANFGTVTVEEVYSDGTKKATAGYTLSLASGTAFVAGANTVTVTYTANTAYTATFTVFVEAKQAEIKLTYAQTGEIFLNSTAANIQNALTLTVTVDGAATTLTASDYTLTPDLSNGKVSVTYTANGTSFTEDIAVFVTAKAVTGITVNYTQGSTVIYPTSSINGLAITVTANYNDGTSANLTASDYTVSGNLAVGVSTLSVSYTDGGKTFATTFDVTVTAQAAGTPTQVAVNWGALTFTFDGEEKKPAAYYYIDGGKYEVALTVTVSGTTLTNGKAINAGTYTATVNPNAVYAGYQLTGTFTQTFTITEAQLEIQWTNGSVSDFDGTAQTPAYLVTSQVNDGAVSVTLQITAKNGASLTNGEAVNAGTYTAKLIITNGTNYTVVGSDEFDFTIAKAKVEKTPAVAVDESKKFETEQDAIDYVKSLYGDRKVSITAKTTDDGIEVTVTLQDAENYEWQEGGSTAQSFKFGTGASVKPAIGGLTETDKTIMIVLLSVMVAAAAVSVIAMVIALKKPKNKGGDDGGFYDAYEG